MYAPALFRHFPALTEDIPWQRIIPGNTPTHKLNTLSKSWHHENLFVKREDKTDSVYGGNKVRNLEFLFGQAAKEHRSQLLTVAPLGSNFVAALAAQAKKLNYSVEVEHFIPVSTRQTIAHWEFTENQGAKLNLHSGRIGTIPAAIAAWKTQHNPKRKDKLQWIAPGGSSVTGALGHVNAIFELEEQIKNGEIPNPDVIVVGVGTCGTMAGMLAAHRILGIERRIIGVRCVDWIVCNRRSVSRLANAVLQKLEPSQAKIRMRDVELISPPRDMGYGAANRQMHDMIQSFREEEGIQLDTTYTAKVTVTLQRLLAERNIAASDKVLYWHTFSGKASGNT